MVHASSMSRLGAITVVLAATVLAALPLGSRAQEVVAASHPIVGAWLLTVDVSDTGLPPHLVVYHADGTYTDRSVGRGGGVGVWEPIDATSVATNVLFHSTDQAGNAGLTRIRTITTVDESGDAYTSDYTREVIGADGATTGQLGPGTAQGERITLEQRGTPVAPMQNAGTPNP